MSEITTSQAPVASTVPTFAIGQVLPWLIFAGLLLVVAMYFVSADEGATALIAGNAIHEWTHDGRHALGFPCH
jgi:cobalt transporter subunit CbtB